MNCNFQNRMNLCWSHPEVNAESNSAQTYMIWVFDLFALDWYTTSTCLARAKQHGSEQEMNVDSVRIGEFSSFQSCTGCMIDPKMMQNSGVCGPPNRWGSCLILQSLTILTNSDHPHSQAWKIQLAVDGVYNLWSTRYDARIPKSCNLVNKNPPQHPRPQKKSTVWKIKQKNRRN